MPAVSKTTMCGRGRRTVESFAAAGQRGRGRVRVVAAVEHALHAVTLPVMDDGLPGLGKLAAARWVGRGGGDGQRCFPVKFAPDPGGTRRAWARGGGVSRVGSGCSLLADVCEAHGEASKVATDALTRA